MKQIIPVIGLVLLSVFATLVLPSCSAKTDDSASEAAACSGCEGDGCSCKAGSCECEGCET